MSRVQSLEQYSESNATDIKEIDRERERERENFRLWQSASG